MEKISLRKRVLYYILLFGMSFIAIVVGYCGHCLYKAAISIFLISHYIFGLTFLKTKYFLKLIVPLATAILSFGTIWLLEEKLGDMIDSELFFYFVLCFIVIFVWEITYQILIKCLNKSASSQELL